MIEIKISPARYTELAPAARLRAWKWWFWLLVVVGLIAAAWGLWRGFSAVGEVTSSLTLIRPAYAAAQTDPVPPPQRGSDAIRPYVMVGILTLIATITLVSLRVSLYSTNERSVETASDLLKTCIGFFIGVATSYFGG